MTRLKLALPRLLCLHAVLAVVVVGLMAAAHPKPAAVPYRWELDFEPGDLRMHVDTAEGRAYWFFNYKVVNNSGKDRVWAPSFVLFTDQGEILKSGDGVPPRITAELMAVLGNPLMENQFQAIGDIKIGEENAKEGLVIWSAGQTAINELKLFVGGISGETVRVVNPITGEESVLRKTLQRSYLVPGDPLARGHDPIQVTGEEWIMR
jgi:hypothetical protein